jgi:hypothetical protein
VRASNVDAAHVDNPLRAQDGKDVEPERALVRVVGIALAFCGDMHAHEIVSYFAKAPHGPSFAPLVDGVCALLDLS